jgi:hypothetical protein
MDGSWLDKQRHDEEGVVAAAAFKPELQSDADTKSAVPGG